MVFVLSTKVKLLGKGHSALTISSLTPNEICLVRQQLKNLVGHPSLFFHPSLSYTDLSLTD